ncbi:hypothetical protein [Butyricicoccus sp.]|uniref:hypothetical protein n=1 Tax=Butyricicoccus sp. TaxID=2049021 RepID=UPI003D7CE816
MKNAFSKGIIPLFLGVLVLSGCGAQASQAATGSGSGAQSTQQQAVSTVETESSPVLIQKAFDISVDAITPETAEAGKYQLEFYPVSDGKIVISRSNTDMPEFLYYFKDDNSTEEPQEYAYPDTIASDTKNFLSQVLDVHISKDVTGIYGYQNRIGVLLQADDGSYFHVQFMPNSNTVIGYQHFDTLESANTFYEQQSAKKLA